jgi:hypothetical protein
MNQITAKQIENLFDNRGPIQLPNGDTLTHDDLVQYIDACDIDTDDNGRPTEDQWQILADVLGAPDPANMTELVDVIATTSALQEVVDAPHVAVLRDSHDCISIEVQDVNGHEDIDTTRYATFGELGIFEGGLTNDLNVRTAALRWLRDNGWETVADRQAVMYASGWRITEPLPVHPAANDDLSQVAIAASRIGQAEEARDEAIRTALAAGHSVISIAEKANLSRARIYQIRDGRR